MKVLELKIPDRVEEVESIRNLKRAKSTKFEFQFYLPQGWALVDVALHLDMKHPPSHFRRPD